MGFYTAADLFNYPDSLAWKYKPYYKFITKKTTNTDNLCVIEKQNYFQLLYKMTYYKRVGQKKVT